MPESQSRQTIISMCIVCVIFYLVGLLWPVCGFIMGVFVQERNPGTSKIILENMNVMVTLPSQWIDSIFNLIPNKPIKEEKKKN